MNNSWSMRRCGFVFFAAVLSALAAAGAGAGLFSSAESLAKYARNPRFHWQQVETEHFTVYYEAGTAVVPRLGEIRRSVEASRTAVLDLAQVDDFPDRIHVFLVDSRPRMKDLMGAGQFGGAIAKIRVVFAVVNRTNNGCSTHEICHVITGAVWGQPERWIDEGFATWSDERWRNRDVLVAGLAAQGRLLPLKTLAEDFLKQPQEAAYLEAASFLGFVVERYGMEKLKLIWKGGFKSIPQVLGRSVDEVEKEWRAALPVKKPELQKPASQ